MNELNQVEVRIELLDAKEAQVKVRHTKQCVRLYVCASVLLQWIRREEPH